MPSFEVIKSGDGSKPLRTFRFLELDESIRKKIYESLPITSTLNEVVLNMNHPFYDPTKCGLLGRVWLVTLGVCVQLLATCKQICRESYLILMGKLQEIRRRIPRIVYHRTAWPLLVRLSPLHEWEGIMVAVYQWLLRLLENRFAHFRAWTTSLFLVPDRAFPGQPLSGTLKFIYQAGIQLEHLQNQERWVPGRNADSPIVAYCAYIVIGDQGWDPELSREYFERTVNTHMRTSLGGRWSLFDRPYPPFGSNALLGMAVTDGNANETAAMGDDCDSQQLWNVGWVNGERVG